METIKTNQPPQDLFIFLHHVLIFCSPLTTFSLLNAFMEMN